MSTEITEFLENVSTFLGEKGYQKHESEYSWKLQEERVISNQTFVINGQMYQQPQTIPISVQISYTGEGSICTIGEPEEVLLQFNYKIQSGMQEPVEVEDCYYLSDFEVFKRITNFFTQQR